MKLQEKEYLSFEESNAIKGFLILLVILGHVRYVVTDHGLIYNYLYKFHIFCFFILPFFYNKKNSLSTKKIRDIFIKFYIPYFAFFILCTFSYLWINKSFVDFNLWKSIYTFFNGTRQILETNMGCTYLWFLPTFCAFSVIKVYFENSKQTIKFLIVLVSIFLIFSSKIGYGQIISVVPLAFAMALYYFSFGSIAKYLIDKIPNIKYYGLLLFIVLNIIYFLQIDSKYLGLFLGLIFPIFAFMCILSLKKIIIRIPYIMQIGKLSFSIYLTHVIVYNILERLFEYNLLNATIVLILTVLLSILVSFWINKIAFIQKIFFPKGYSDILSLFSSKNSHN
jgi:fucose 4-O-acetylase-like acetyltransferase